MVSVCIILLVFSLRCTEGSVLRPFRRGLSDALSAISRHNRVSWKSKFGSRSQSHWPWDKDGSDAQSAPSITKKPTWEASVSSDVVYGQGLICSEAYDECKSLDLLLSVYDPEMDSAMPRPAMVLVHGVGPSRHDDSHTTHAAEYYSRRGFVVFIIDCRGFDDHGLYPCPKDGCACPSVAEWWSNPCYTYAAVRDFKAAIRFVRANSRYYNVDSDLIVASGSSVGATNILLASLADEDLFKSELDATQDPTLRSTNLEYSSSISMAIVHWPLIIAIENALSVLGADRFKGVDISSILHFHGSEDFYANFTAAVEFSNDCKKRDFHYELVTLGGCEHLAYCGTPFDDGRTCDDEISTSEVIRKCTCETPCNLQDTYALPVIAEELGLNLV
eukprot:TRINITY_DN34422_c0_g1_i1.p1 TRINITY_DN34422_c0_g1~~TRINITY_DN34422_c0_g1_i1.p1  ORF type:complete len:389 (+),score=28.71 TRINITY_DN34422_c0_g1_i1:150-1316(+)